MIEGLLHLIARRPLFQVAIDVIDILLVAWVIYRALLVLRGTRAVQMGTGLGIVFAVYVVSKWLGFVTLFNLLSTLLSSIILVVVVIFQNDIRRGLMRVGASALLGNTARQQESKVIEEVVSAATELARHRIGALICFEQDANLDEFVAGAGTPIDASVQRDLIVSLFVPEGVNRLHDGALIIRNLRIAAAGVFFPIPDARGLDRSLGTRHRAALGVSEETDAVVVVVSEESGTISVCFSGNIISHLDGASLRHALSGLFGEEAKKQAAKRATKPSIRAIPRIGSDEGDRALRDHAGPLSERVSLRPPSMLPPIPDVPPARTSGFDEGAGPDSRRMHHASIAGPTSVRATVGPVTKPMLATIKPTPKNQGDAS